MSKLGDIFTVYPLLTSDGMGVILKCHGPKTWDWHYEPPQGREAEFERELEKGRKELVDRYPAICVIWLWLLKCPKLKGPNDWHSSYSLKHLCEKHMLAPQYRTYVSNGEFITAAIMAGFKVYKNIYSPNPKFNMAERWLRTQQSREESEHFIDLGERAQREDRANSE
jgi:hypothetical protein